MAHSPFDSPPPKDLVESMAAGQRGIQQTQGDRYQCPKCQFEGSKTDYVYYINATKCPKCGEIYAKIKEPPAS